MDKKALQLCSRFALTPNQLGYCGKDSAPAKLQKCVVTSDCSRVEEELKKFIVLNPYLQTIAKATDLSPFSYEVIEAYWLGSDLLDQIKLKHYDLLLENFISQGVPDFLVEELKNKQPKKFIPIHLFNILHVGVGRASGSVPFNIDSINNCMLRWGTVSKVNKNESTAQVEVTSLKAVSSFNPLTEGSSRKQSASTSGISYEFAQRIKTFNFNPAFTPNLKVGDNVAVHWGFIPKILSKDEQKKLSFYTKLLIENL
jgi:hypothetical protein